MASQTAPEKVDRDVDPAPAHDTPATSSLDTKEKIEYVSSNADIQTEGTVTKDGINVHPQPTTDPLDPLNWPRWRKRVILAIVMTK